jgi:O-Antigen ligase
MRRAGLGGGLAAAAGALVAFAVLFGQGSSDGRLFWIGIAALMLTAVGWIVRPAALSGAGVVFFVLLGALVVWQAVSIHWSIEPARSWDYANRGLVYLAFAAVGALLGGFPRARIAEAFAALLSVVFVVALAAKVVPAFYDDYGRLARLRFPLEYWNELGLLAAAAVPLALWLATRRRIAGSLLLYAALVTVVLTFSRFGVLLALLAAVAWLVVERDRLDSFSALAAALPPAAVVAGISLALPGIANDGEPHSTRVRDGLIFAALLIVGAAVVAFGSRWNPAVASRRRLAVQAAAAAVLVCVGTAIALIVHAGGPIAFVQHRWHEFSATQSVGSTARFGSASSGNRWTWWQQAWSAFTHHPGGGTGAGTFALTSTVDAHNSLQTTVEPHNTPLQFLSETGIVGFLLYAGVIASVVVAFVRGPRDRATLALGMAALVAVVHSVIDIDWNYVATQGPLLAIGGVLVSRPAEARRAQWLLAAATAACCLAGIYSLFAPWWSNRQVNAAYDEWFIQGKPAAALTDAKTAHALNPLALEPLYLLAGLEQDGRYVRQAVEREPRNPDPWYQLAVFNYARGNYRAAYDAANRSWHLDAFGPAGQPGAGNVLNLARCKLFPTSPQCPP